MKKAQSISINTIIVAAIALIVMVVVILIFTGRLKGFNVASNVCENNGGKCVAYGGTSIFGSLGSTGRYANCEGDFKRVASEYDCPDPDNQFCCINLE